MKNYSVLLIKIVLGITILVLVIGQLNLEQIQEVLRNSEWRYVLLAFLLTFLSLVFMTSKWRIFVTTYQEIRYRELFCIYWSSNFISLFGLGCLGEEGYKCIHFRDRKKALLLSFSDKALSLLWYILLAISLFLSFVIFQVEIQIIVSSVLLYCTFIYISLRFKNVLLEKMATFFKVIGASDFITKDQLPERVILLHSVFSTFFIINFALINLALFHAVSADVSFTKLLLFMPVLIIGLTLPISFQGIGIREFLFVQFANFIAISPEKALVVSLLGYLISQSYRLLGAAPFLAKKRKIDDHPECSPNPIF